MKKNLKIILLVIATFIVLYIAVVVLQNKNYNDGVMYSSPSASASASPSASPSGTATGKCSSENCKECKRGECGTENKTGIACCMSSDICKPTGDKKTSCHGPSDPCGKILSMTICSKTPKCYVGC